MTTGQLLFFGGIVLLGLTVLLAIIFIIKKPKYIPESAAYNNGNPAKTQGLRNGYPTDRVTVRREPVQPSTAKLAGQAEETVLLTEKLTEPLPSTEQLQETEWLELQQAEVLTEESHL